jgi:hypothetical protein
LAFKNRLQEVKCISGTAENTGKRFISLMTKPAKLSARLKIIILWENLILKGMTYQMVDVFVLTALARRNLPSLSL